MGSRCTNGTMPVPTRKSGSVLAESVRSVLSTRKLSVAKVSRASRSAETRAAHIPHSFYSSLRKPSFSPSLYQLHFLSRLTGYRLADWLVLFGISLDEVSRF